MKKHKVLIYIVITSAIIIPITYLEFSKVDKVDAGESIDISIMSKEDRGSVIANKREKYDSAKEIVLPSGFINTQPFNLADHIGKEVILLDMWTYSCINCQRTLPYVNTWSEKYKDQGLLVVGIHTPEFEFEKDIENVKDAVEKFGIKYPVVLDNDYGTWRAYSNRYWPRKYLIDIDGFIVYDHKGEGRYDETERKIQELLEERSGALRLSADVD